MNILIINPILATPTSSGLQKLSSIRDTMIYGMCLGFKSLGHHPTLIAAEDYKPDVDEGDYDFPVIFFPTSLRKIFKPTLLPYMPSLTGWLRQHADDFDLIISKECFSMPTLQAARTLGDKLIVWQEMASHQRKFFKLPSRFWHNLIARPMMRKATVVGCSESARDFISHYLPNIAGKTVEHGIDDTKFFPVALLEKKRQLITSSQLIKRKNVASIIRKFARLAGMPSYSDVRLIIAGDGEQREALQTLAHELGIEDRVEFKGFLPREELGRLVASSIAFLVDTLADLNVISIVEAIAAGTPVVTNRIPLTASWIAYNNLGIAKDNWDEDDLAYMIDHAEEYTENCRQIAPTLSNKASAEALISLKRHLSR